MQNIRRRDSFFLFFILIILFSLFFNFPLLSIELFYFLLALGSLLLDSILGTDFPWLASLYVKFQKQVWSAGI